jgi:hypothetical protein
MYNQVSAHICKKHKYLLTENPLSPCRGRCRKCKRKKVSGYTNPDSTPNPFGYLYLIPVLCFDCSEGAKKCMWCSLS